MRRFTYDCTLEGVRSRHLNRSTTQKIRQTPESSLNPGENPVENPNQNQVQISPLLVWVAFCELLQLIYLWGTNL